MKCKKLLSVALSLLMAQSIVATTAINSSAVDTQQVVSGAETEEVGSTYSYNGYEYNVNNGKATITKYTGSASNLTIPSTLGGYAVTGIGADAFYRCEALKSVTMFNSVKSIGDGAFYGCTLLANITIPDSVIDIGENAFEDTAWYNNQPDGLVYAGKVAYKYKGEMPENTKISLRAGTKGIASRVFSVGLVNCFNLTEITIPDSVTYIGGSAFSGCSALTSVTIPDSVTSIGSFAFYDCYGLTSVTIPKSVTVIGLDAFGYGRFGKITNLTHLTNTNLTIQGYKGTAAETYANENGFKFVALKDTVNPTSIKLNKTAVTLGVGESVTLTKTVTPSNASTSYTWSSSNTSVATVSSSGKITAKKAGTANITVKTSNGKTANCTITVKNAPTKLSLNRASITLGVGELFDLNIALPSKNAAYNVEFSSSNTAVATVTSVGGVITSKGVGTAVITATTYNGKKATCVVTVKNAPSEISIAPTEITLGVGEVFYLTNSLPENTASFNIKYASRNTNIATVTSLGGVITAKGVGTVTINAISHNGKTSKCKVTIKNAPDTITLNETAITLKVGETFDLDSTLPAGTASYSIKYTTRNSKVVSVNSSSGLVTAKGVGTATITAITHNGKKATCIVTVK